MVRNLRKPLSRSRLPDAGCSATYPAWIIGSNVRAVLIAAGNLSSAFPAPERSWAPAS